MRPARAGSTMGSVGAPIAMMALLALSGCLQAVIMGQPGGSSSLSQSSTPRLSISNRKLSAGESYPIRVQGSSSGDDSFSLLSGAGTIDLTRDGAVFVAPDSPGQALVEVVDSAGDSAHATFQTTVFSQASDQVWIQPLTAIGQATLQAITVDPLGNVYATGVDPSNNNQQIVRQWSNSSWSTVANPQAYWLQNGLWGNDVLLEPAGNLYNAIVESGNLQLNYWNGSSWNSTICYTTAQLQADTGLGDGIYMYGLPVPSVTFDSSGNTYIAVRGETWNYISYWVVREFNGVSWSTIDVVSNAAEMAMASDAFGNVYVAGAGNADLGPNSWIVKQWNGSSWTVIDNFQPAGYTAYPQGMAVDSAGNVYVVGDLQLAYSGGPANWIVRKWDGTSWTTVDDYLGPDGASGAYAESIALDSAGNIYVGGSSGGNGWIVRQWNGSSWATTDNYQDTWSYTSPENTNLQSMAVDPNGNLYGAGYVQGTGPGATYYWLVGKWDGTNWNILDDYQYPSPTTQAEGTQATSLAVDPATGDLYAAGVAFDASNLGHWIVRKWNGSSWATTDDFSYSGGQYSQAVGVAVGSNGQVFAAGNAVDGSGLNHWVVRQWTGSAWSTLDDYVYPSGNSTQSVALTSDSFGNLFVTGMAYDSSWVQHWIVREWNGSSWNTVDDYQYADGQNDQPGAIGADTAGNVYVAGWANDSNGTIHNILRQWNGSNWTVVDDNIPAAGANGYTSVVVDSQGSVYAGARDNQGDLLVRKWNGYMASTVEDTLAPGNQPYQWSNPLAYSAKSGAVYAGGIYQDSSNDMHWLIQAQP